MAAEKNRLEIASALLARHVDVNAVTSSGMWLIPLLPTATFRLI